MSDPIISISGLRGIVGEQLTPIVAAQYAASFCETLPPGPVVLSRDGRVSGKMLCDSIAAAIMACGRDCIDLDVASTPTAGFVVREDRAAGGIQVSASHNPPPYNGMKLFGADGRVLSSGPGEEVLSRYRAGERQWVDVNQIGRRLIRSNVWHGHLEAILKTVDVDRIRSKRFRVLLDSNHGAGGDLGRALLDKLGCEAEILGEQPTGLFWHPPEPLAENLTAVSPRVPQGAFRVGFCQDPDADRLAIIDETGHFIGEEFTAVLCALRRLMKTPGALVTNCASSGMTKYLAERFHVPFEQSAVGEANVADAMIRADAVYGGEGSGGPIDPKVGYIRDSFVGMAQILDLMAATEKSIAEIVRDFPPRVMLKDKMTLSKEDLVRSIEQLKSTLNFGDAGEWPTVSMLDGVRMDWADRWILLRGSNTEPIVRLIAEAPTPAAADELILSAKRIIEQQVHSQI